MLRWQSTVRDEGAVPALLAIRNNQIKILASLKQAEYVDRLLPHLASDYPSWYQKHQEPGARAFVERAIETGEKHNVRGQAAVSTLVDLMVEFGENFESSPDREWAVKLLAHPSLPDQTKVPMLADRLRARTGGRRIVEIEAG